MYAQWTADVIGKMHLNGIKRKQLADELNWHEKYLSRVLNCHVEPKGAEEKVRRALQKLISVTATK